MIKFEHEKFSEMLADRVNLMKELLSIETAFMLSLIDLIERVAALKEKMAQIEEDKQ